MWKAVFVNVKENITSDNLKHRCVQYGINLPDNHNNKRCNICRCDNTDRAKKVGGSILLGTAFVALSGLFMTEEDNFIEDGHKCTHCFTDMEYDDYEEEWTCPDCGHKVSRWDAYGTYI